MESMHIFKLRRMRFLARPWGWLFKALVSLQGAERPGRTTWRDSCPERGGALRGLSPLAIQGPLCKPGALA